MNSIYILIPLLVVILTFTFGVLRTLFHLWIQHRVKLSLLQKYEDHPELFESSEEVLKLLEKQERSSQRANRQDYTLTGTLLAFIGIACVIAGHIVAVGKIAVGIYLGGVICIILGILIALVGLLVRALGKSPSAATPEDSEEAA